MQAEKPTAETANLLMMPDRARDQGRWMADAELLLKAGEAAYRAAQERDVDARGAGEHVPDEPLVPRHVDDPEAHVAQVEAREPDVDRDPPRLLLRQTIGVHAGQRPHQRGLAVVDVSGGSEDHGEGQ